MAVHCAWQLAHSEKNNLKNYHLFIWFIEVIINIIMCSNIWYHHNCYYRNRIVSFSMDITLLLPYWWKATQYHLHQPAKLLFMNWKNFSPTAFQGDLSYAEWHSIDLCHTAEAMLSIFLTKLKEINFQLFCINRKGSASCSGVGRCIVLNKVWNLVLLTYNFNKY